MYCFLEKSSISPDCTTEKGLKLWTRQKSILSIRCYMPKKGLEFSSLLNTKGLWQG